MFLDYNYFRGKSMIKLESDKWIEGYAFSVHTLYSIYVGENEYGHPTYDTKRTQMGELVYQLKYKQDISVLPQIIALLKSDQEFVDFIKKDFVILVPATRKNRQFQPVEVVADLLHENGFKNIYAFALTRTKNSD